MLKVKIELINLQFWFTENRPNSQTYYVNYTKTLFPESGS